MGEDLIEIIKKKRKKYYRIKKIDKIGESSNKIKKVLIKNNKFKELELIIIINNQIYSYDNQWRKLYKGNISIKINDIDISENNIIRVATNRGIFELIDESKIKNRMYLYNKIDDRSKKEPSIDLILEWAIEYADVNQTKINNWYNKSKKRNFLPKVSFKVEEDRSKTIQYEMYKSLDKLYIIPNKRTDDKDVDWSINLSWELSNLLWTEDQIDINLRSRLIVELRDDIIHLITRIYFEREKLKIELNKIVQNEGREEMYIEKYFRIKELTAIINAYTNNKYKEYIMKYK